MFCLSLRSLTPASFLKLAAGEPGSRMRDGAYGGEGSPAAVTFKTEPVS